MIEKTGSQFLEFSEGPSCKQTRSTCVCVWKCVRGHGQWDGFMTVPAHMANHVERCAKRRRTESGRNVIWQQTNGDLAKYGCCVLKICKFSRAVVNKQMSKNALVIALFPVALPRVFFHSFNPLYSLKQKIKLRSCLLKPGLTLTLHLGSSIHCQHEENFSEGGGKCQSMSGWQVNRYRWPCCSRLACHVEKAGDRGRPLRREEKQEPREPASSSSIRPLVLLGLVIWLYMSVTEHIERPYQCCWILKTWIISKVRELDGAPFVVN